MGDRLAGETEVDLPAPLTTVVFLALAVDPPAPATVDPLMANSRASTSNSRAPTILMGFQAQ
jgi:hypothetical protein